MAGSKGQNHQISLPGDTVSLDPNGFEPLIETNGVLMEHYRAIRCPIGVTDRFDVRSHSEHSNCMNGYLYKLAGEISVSFTGNTTSSRLDPMGSLDGSSVQVTLPRHYISGEEVAVQNYDRFFLKELATTSVNTQLIEAHITGVDRLQYRAIYVEHIIDANGVEYGSGDYEIQDGNIVWLSKRPMFDPKTGRGTVYAIRYRYTPFWYVDRLIHEVRVARSMQWQGDVPVHVLERMPHAILLKREFLFENEERLRNSPADARDAKSPRSGSFGSR